MQTDQRPIAVLDSGLGGLTVVREIRKTLPGENIVYFGDTAHLPYGSKTAATVTGFVRQIISYLRPRRPKHVVIACNTATALALPALRTYFPDLSISGVIEPGAKAAVVAAGAREVPIIGVIATEATVRSKAYERAVHRRRNHARLLLRPTPLLVPLIEEGRGDDDPVVQLALKHYLRPLVKHRVDVLVLGCTHYPIYKELIAGMVGPAVRVIDSAEQCADDVARRIGAIGSGRYFSTALDASAEFVSSSKAESPSPGGYLQCLVTDDPERFGRLAPRFLGEAVVPPPVLVSPEELAGGGPDRTRTAA